MAAFINMRKKRQLDDWQMLASVGYSTGLIASMSLSKTRPRFNDIYNFPKEKTSPTDTDVEFSKAQMLAWALKINNIDKKRR